MENDLYYEYATIDDCKSRCDNYSDDYDERCNGINYVTSNQRCFLYAKARELESTELANRQSTYRPCTNPPQCANWCSYKGINGWCKNCNFDKCQDCTECNEPNLCTIRSTECRPWCHTHPGVHYRCSFEKFVLETSESIVTLFSGGPLLYFCADGAASRTVDFMFVNASPHRTPKCIT